MTGRDTKWKAGRHMDGKEKKTLAVIANQEGYAAYIAEMLKVYFADTLEFRCYESAELLDMEEMEEEYIVLSAVTVFQTVKQRARKGAHILILDLTLRKDALEALKPIPDGTKALLVNIDYRNCMETITLIYDMGITGLELIPYYPGCKCDPSIRLAVTAGEAHLVPEGMEAVIDLGHREIDANTIYRIAKTMGIENPFLREENIRRRDNLINLNLEMDDLFSEYSNLSDQLSTLLGLMKQGILITDMEGTVYLANQTAEKMLRDFSSLQGADITELLPGLELGKDPDSPDYAAEQLIDLNNRSVSAAMSPVESGGKITGRVIMLEYFNQAEHRQHKLRRKLRDSEHRASYTFEQILGESPQIREAKKIAMRMAESDSSICLYGESGTGKELFAQSIHNYSRRRDYQFVAINCAALPENLLESELYGYEEGAFSGAKKGGQIGLFELAHQGTLFLDEIEEMSLKMQAKLLRAIEERKIIRVGGRNLIDVDVRIICASNMELAKMVEEGAFRRDLYYRIHVLPVKIPPLTERKGDVFLLMEAMKKEIGASYTLSERARNRLKEYTWPGNVRELKNITEYLANLGKAVIEAEDIPLFLTEKTGEDAGQERARPAASADCLRFSRDEEAGRFLLSEIDRARKAGRNIGRQALTEIAKGRGFFLTEGEIRRLLKKLAAEGFIISHPGRKGSCLTDKGRDYIKQE